jgi:hypothetical protein
MICFAWSDIETAADLLAKLPEPWTAAREFTITDPDDHVTYAVIAYTIDGEEIPDDYDPTEPFLRMLHTIILPEEQHA